MSNGTKQMTTLSPCPIKAPLIVTIIGLPCRGKSFAARKISRNLFWKGEQVKGKVNNYQSQLELNVFIYF